MIQEAYRPSSLDQFVGQAELKKKLETHIHAAMVTGNPLPHTLLTSGPGQGKTTLAHLIAARLTDPITCVDLSQVKPTQFVHMLRDWEGGILFLDEIHRATRAQMEQLLTLMEEGFVLSPGGGRVYAEWLTVIAATTEPDKLPPALVSRFTIRPEFARYTDEEAAQIVAGMATSVGLKMPEETAQALGKACTGTPRLARDLVEAYRALSFQREVPSVEETLSLAGVDEEGLTSKHLAYLRSLDRMDGLAGIAPLVSVLQMHPTAVKEVERVLYERGYVTFTTRGRAITAKGHAKISPRRGTVARHRRVTLGDADVDTYATSANAQGV